MLKALGMFYALAVCFIRPCLQVASNGQKSASGVGLGHIFEWQIPGATHGADKWCTVLTNFSTLLSPDCLLLGVSRKEEVRPSQVST